MSTIFECGICGFKYKTRNGLYKHNKNNHSLNDNTFQVNEYNCQYCGKIFKHRQSRWTHEKNCKNKNQCTLSEQIKNLTNEIKELKSKPNIVNNTTNNTTNIQYIINQPGTESIKHLPIEKQREIMQKGLNSLIYLIKMTNFDKNIPENHSYCVTALNDKHASVIDITTNAIIKTDKTELFDKVLIGNIKKLETMAENKDFCVDERANYRQKFEELKNILFRSKRGTKVYYNELNLLSYNNKDLVYDTWTSLKSLDDIINSEENCGNITNEIKQSDFKNSPNKISINDYINNSSDSELSDDSESDSEIDEIIIKGKHYIIEDSFLFVKKSNNTKGEIYGKYVNGKVVKLYYYEKEIEL